MSGGTGQGRHTVDAPNLLVIVVDQLRYDCVGYAQKYPVKTPNIDKMAASGLWFNHAFSHIPLCSPARQSMLNGRRPESFGALWNYNNGLKVSALPTDAYAWPRQLKDRTYQTCYIGKWNVSPDSDPRDFGYDIYVSDKEYGDYQSSLYPTVEYGNDYFGEVSPIPLEDAETHWLASRATDVMKTFNQSELPWHVRVDFPEPHLPCRPSVDFANMYPSESIPKWHNFEESFERKPYIQKQQLYNWGVESWCWEDWAPIVSRYYAVISQVDDAIGQILGTLDDLAIRENTIVIFTSDHGDMCGTHRMMDKHYVLYEDVIRVPLVIRWPQGISRTKRVDEFVYNFLDLPPTILEMLNIESTATFHGQSFVACFQGEMPKDWRRHIVSTYNGQQFGLFTQRMIRDERYKYVWNTTDVDEFYDLQLDGGELVNRIYEREYESAVRDMREALYDELMRCGDGLVNNPWMKRQLCSGRKI